MRGRFIAIEGIDGAGTTTQIRRLAETLAARGHAVHVTAEPSTGVVGTHIRTLLRAPAARPDPALMALLFAADRLAHFAHEIEPALTAGRHVFTDRYVLSSLAYQSLELPLGWVKELNARAPQPDLTVLVRVDPAVAAARRHGRGGAAELYDADALQRRIAAHYDQLAAALPASGVAVIDGNLGADQVAADLLAVVLPWVGAA